MEVAIWGFGGLIVLFALDRFLLWMEAKGWIYWRKTKRRPGAMGDILTGFGFTDPGMRYLEEARREHVHEDEEDGDDDGRRKSSDRLT
jgi:hypothetical protein